MQRQFTIELRVDFPADTDKNDVMKTAVLKAARHVYATACLIAEGVKPQIAVVSDDFFSGHQEIKLFDDAIAQGVALLDEAGDPPEEPVSDEMLAAVREMNT